MWRALSPFAHDRQTGLNHAAGREAGREIGDGWVKPSYPDNEVDGSSVEWDATGHAW